jgi:hypothetical protein
MLDVHPIRHALGSWREFTFHIVTITVGLLIAIALEQSVEKLHHLRERHQLQHDLLEEAARNRETLIADLRLESESAWFRAAMTTSATVSQGGDRLTLSLAPTPCIPGTLGANGTDATINTYYFAPSEAVWITAKDAGLIARLPVEEARMYARLEHNNLLQADERDRVELACNRIAALQTRFATIGANGTSATWELTALERGQLADAAASADTALRALLWRMRWNLRFEEGILRGQRNVDLILMNDAVTAK